LLTLDVDFADIRTYPPERFDGLIVMRLAQQEKPHLLAVLEGILPMLETEQIHGRLWIVEESRVRVRSAEH